MNAKQRDALLANLRARFGANMTRHSGVAWSDVLQRLESNPKKLASLEKMEATGGEPNVVAAESTGEMVFFDCSPESPSGRRSLCYDAAALASRKENKPKGSACGMADDLGIDILTEEQYRMLQTLGRFDLKTSSWVLTPSPIRKLGGALFCDRRYDQVFVYHNGAESYYAARGFRGAVKV